MTDDSPFRFLNSILNGKESIVETEEDVQAYKKLMFLTNRGLSQHPDAILYVNEMNQMPHLSPKMQYDYLFHSIRKMRRPFNKWPKGVKSEDVELIQQHYNYSAKKAKEVLHYFPNVIKELKAYYGEKK